MVTESQVVEGALFDLRHVDRRGTVRRLPVRHVNAMAHADVEFTVSRALRATAERAEVRRMIDHSLAPNGDAEFFNPKRLPILRRDEGEVGDRLEIVTLINTAFDQAIMIAGDHSHRTGLIGDHLH